MNKLTAKLRHEYETEKTGHTQSFACPCGPKVLSGICYTIRPSIGYDLFDELTVIHT